MSYERISLGAMASYLNTFVSVLSNFILVPLYLLHLGSEQYGLWLLVQSVVSYLGFSNLGIAQSVSNLIAAKYAERDDLAIRVIASSGFWLYLVIVSVVMLLLLPSMYFIPFDNMFDTSDDLKGLVFPVLMVSSIFFLCKLPLTIFSSTLRSLNLIYKEQLFALIATLIQVFGILVVLWSDIGIIGLAFVYGVTGLFLGLALAVHLRKEIPGFTISIKYADFIVARQIIVPGGYFFLLQLSGALIAGSDNIIIASFQDVSSVPAYAVAFQFCMLTIGLVSVLTSSMIPSITIAYSENNMEYLAELYLRGLQICFAIAILVAVGFLSVGPDFIIAWVGKENYVGNSIFYCLVGFVFITIIIWPADALLVGTTQHKGYALMVALEGMLNIGLSIWWIQLWGLFGVAAATFVSRALISGWFVFYASAKITNIGLSAMGSKIFVPLLIPFFGIILGSYIINLVSLSGWYSVFLGGGWLLVIYVVLVYSFSFTDKNRESLSKLIRSKFKTGNV